ncbi:hephaestin 1 [Labeo rohita]|uniref:ferroxidase n=1 Tax=Labeo rohita TaxID=84645 RepID=A0A498M835_LABRO|nr:hephaestin 1 [Labeo rohita]
MHQLFRLVLGQRDLSRAGDLFSLDDSEIEDCLSQALEEIKVISCAPDYLTNDNDQAVVEICITRITTAIRETGSIEKHGAALVSLWESCLEHNLQPQGKDEDTPHAKIASDITSCILQFVKLCCDSLSIRLEKLFCFYSNSLLCILGALYPDGTTGRDKSDDAVAPGESYTYTWHVKPEYAPTEADASCLTWIYHSHGDAPKDIASGLIGALLTCKQGTLDSSQKRSDVDEDFILMFSVVDENLSWYLEENIEKFCSDPDTAKNLIQDEVDEEFRESNLMHSINGYVYGNLPALKVCVGRPVSWHLFGIAGMQSFYEVSACGSSASPTETPGKERHFYIAAEEMIWDYAPSGMNYMTNESLIEGDSDSESYFSRDGGKLGGKYLKARYISYTDDTFTTKTHIAGSDKHLGILGPVIKAEAGDVIIVTFLNRATRDYSIQPHGLHYEKAYEGAKYQDGTQKAGASVAPGERFVYRWRVLEGPSSSDPACLSYLYYSAVDPVRDTNSGLFGPIQVCKKGVLDGSGHQHANKIQHEFFLLFSVMDENESWYLEKNIEEFGSSDSDPANEEFQESNKMHAVNGYMYGNLPGLDLCNGEHTMWHILGLGTEVDIHGVYFEGNTFQRDGMNRDTLSVFPHTTVTVSMTPDNNDPNPSNKVTQVFVFKNIPEQTVFFFS